MTPAQAIRERSTPISQPPLDLVHRDERTLVLDLAAGNAESYEQLVRQYGGRMLAVARRLLRDEESARDAVQDAFLSAFRSIGGFREGARLSTWLHRIVVNAALMKLRARGRRPEEPIEDLLPKFLDDGHRAGTDAGWLESAETLIDRRQTRRLVRECIDRLPDTYRAVLLLRDIEELDSEEVAGVLGITPNAVKVRLHRARQALRELLVRARTSDFVA
ncbi:MAG: sigma-70 family RNA polymerase sigma factor [Candidatus Binatia bacterium]